MIKKYAGLIFSVVVLGFVLIQLIPYGRSHSNPPVLKEPTWDRPETRLLAQRACFDCHSNETFWPWYSNIAPISWLAQRDVDDGRRHLNFSEWGVGRREVREVGETILEGKMPPSYYVLLHPQAKLSAQEQNALINGLIASFGAAGVDSMSE